MDVYQDQTVWSDQKVADSLTADRQILRLARYRLQVRDLVYNMLKLGMSTHGVLSLVRGALIDARRCLERERLEKEKQQDDLKTE